MIILGEWAVEELAHLLRAATSRSPPPIFRLETRLDIDRLFPPLRPILSFFDFEIDSRSGTLQVRADLEQLASSPHFDRFGPVENLLPGIAFAIDPRQFIQSNLESEILIGEWTSYLSDQELPVIGPGGRILLSVDEAELTADLTIRHRVGQLPSNWRPMTDLIESIVSRLSSLPPHSSITLELGYFEDSKYSRQDWLRPALLFDVGVLSEADGVGWGQVFVEPMTVSNEIDATEGLGIWSR